MIRFFYKIVTATVTYFPIFWNAFTAIGKNSFRIVYYHMASNKNHDYNINPAITPEEFKKHIVFLKKKFEIISLYEALDKVRNRDSLKNCLALTFDDGFAECYHVIAPILIEEKVPATFFIIENMIDNCDLMWRNKLVCIENSIETHKKHIILKRFEERTGLNINGTDLLKCSARWEMSRKDEYANILWDEANMLPLHEFMAERKPYMNIAQIKELINNGFFIGSHSRSHPRCDLLSHAELEDEMIGSSARISEKIGIPVDLFSYPFGNRPSYDDEIEIAKKGNLKCLLGVEDNLSNFYNPLQWERDEIQISFDKAISFLVLGPLRNKFFR